MFSGTRERVSSQANAEMPNRTSPSHIQPLPIAFTASELPRSFALAALRIIPCLSTTWAHAAKATASKRTAKLWMLTRALPTRANPRASSSRVEVTLRFHLQTPQRRCVATSLAGQLVRPMTYRSLPTFAATSEQSRDQTLFKMLSAKSQPHCTETVVELHSRNHHD